jgi:hypothetical protein
MILKPLTFCRTHAWSLIGNAPKDKGARFGGPVVCRITAIRICRDSYFVSKADGKISAFWEPNLRFETDGSTLGPLAGKPAIMPSGMLGDRAAVIFAAPEEISRFIKHQC